MKPFSELGTLVESRWRDKNYDEKFFPAIAAQALTESGLIDRVDPWEIIRWVHQSPALPQQMDLPAKFADPPITLYAAPRFHIDAYYWLDGTTSIHQHAFSGAFQVLRGSSVHASYRFQVEQEINPHFLVGKLAFRDVSILNRGDIREINPGPEFIHSLFHLERPSVTITIRTYKAQAFPLQYSYLKPYLAVNPFLVDPSLTKRVQTVSLLLHMKHPQADEFIADLLDGSDFQTAHAVLKEAFDFLCHRELEALVGATKSRDRFDALLARARKRHGEISDLLQPVFEEGWRQLEIVRRRAEVKNEDHRFLMALMLNVPNRTRMLELIPERYAAEDPVGLVIEWLKGLAATKTFGSKEANVLGSEALTQDHFLVLEALLRRGTVKEIQPQPPRQFETTRIDEIISELKRVTLLTAVMDAAE